MKPFDPKTIFAAMLLSATIATGGAGLARAVTSDSTPSADLPDSYKDAKEMVEDEDYDKAIPLLEQSMKDKGGEFADAFNMLGYSYRKLGNMPKALEYYNKALAMEPKHLGANEYMGELYLEMKDLPHAEERLAVLKSACSDCDELEDLEKAIKKYKKKNS
jgi:tetratricopeptide (TPR) repeat protein